MTRPRSFVLTATDHGPLIVNRNDFHQRPSGDTYGVGFQLLNFGSYDSAEITDVLHLLDDRRSAVGDGLVVLDCGANIGVHTVEMAAHMTGWGRVIAVEPQERLFYALCGNIALANLENAQALQAAVGSETAMIQMPRPNYNKPASFGSLELRRSKSNEYIGQSISYAERDMVEVTVLSLDGILRRYNVDRLDFLKIDVEGMELDVLTGAREAIVRCRPIILVEWIKVKRPELEAVLDGLGYTSTERGMNLLALPKEPI